MQEGCGCGQVSCEEGLCPFQLVFMEGSRGKLRLKGKPKEGEADEDTEKEDVGCRNFFLGFSHAYASIKFLVEKIKRLELGRKGSNIQFDWYEIAS